MRCHLTVLPILALLLSGCGAPAGPGRAPAGEMQEKVHAVLSASEGATIYSLHPNLHETQDNPEWADHPVFHDYVILGESTVNASVASDVLNAVYEGIDASDGRVAACFDPRHGIRVETEQGAVDLVICYSCLSMAVYLDGEHAQSLLTAESPKHKLKPIWESAGLELHP